MLTPPTPGKGIPWFIAVAAVVVVSAVIGLVTWIVAGLVLDHTVEVALAAKLVATDATIRQTAAAELHAIQTSSAEIFNSYVAFIGTTLTAFFIVIGAGYVANNAFAGSANLSGTLLNQNQVLQQQTVNAVSQNGALTQQVANVNTQLAQARGLLDSINYADANDVKAKASQVRGLMLETPIAKTDASI